jgi:cytidylate kinase
MTLIVAIDGPAAAGKGTLARRLAAAFDLPYLDTGLLYRAVGRKLLLAGVDPANTQAAAAAAQALTEADLARTDLRGPEADRAASLVASVPGVRAALLAFQHFFAREGAVMDGRDIGTVIFPQAPVKLYVTAAVEARAERRWRELASRGEHVPLGAVEADLRTRDALDIARAAAPLRPADDATIIDTTTLTADEAFAQARAIVAARAESRAVGDAARVASHSPANER